MRLGGRARPSAWSAARTRSRDSPTALSGRPTIVKAGRPEAIVTWASTGSTSMPENATVCTRATVPPAPRNPCASVGEAAPQDQLREGGRDLLIELPFDGGLRRRRGAGGDRIRRFLRQALIAQARCLRGFGMQLLLAIVGDLGA